MDYISGLLVTCAAGTFLALLMPVVALTLAYVARNLIRSFNI